MSLLWTALVMGLVGSLHCGVMCGPLVLAVTSTRRSRLSHLAYHSGRITTYCLIGLLFGTLGSTLALAGFQRGLSIVAGFFILVTLLSAARLRIERAAGKLTTRLRSGFTALLKHQNLSSRFALGALNGLLPCGLVYVAAAGAAATATSISGILYMAMFGLGTVPILSGITLLGSRTSMLRTHGARLLPISLGLVGIALILRGLALGIPYLSPATAISCH